MAAFVVSCLFVLLGAALSDACMCIPAHPQTHFCKSDVVIYAVAGNRTVHHEEHSASYQLQVTKTLKKPTVHSDSLFTLDSENMTVTTLVTPEHDATCGINLEPGVKYILGGHIAGGRLVTRQCDLHLPYSELSKRLINGFNHKFHSQCDCEIIYCHGSRCLPPSHNQCIHDYWAYPIDCSDRFTMCRRRSNGHCQWTDNNYNQNCYQTWYRKRILKR